ncbi:uncharacterized protein LOC142566615 [Dermacentor variabilis]|uniref:uncharacterized protein LOC142566615 n=1 Tax=Dermacentor variabilis TaxID=34621 RepID=UPI003F5BD0DE
MQVHGFITGLLLLPAILAFPQATAIPEIQPSTPGAGPLPAPATTDSSCKTAPSLPSLDPHSPWNAPSSATSSPTSAIKPALSSPALCGLGGCASAQATNPLYFAMQVHGFITGLLLLPAILAFPQATAIPEIQPSTPGAGPLPAPATTDSSCKTAPSLPSLDPHSPWNAPSSATSSPTSAIKPALSSPALCGLGGCASAQATNPLYFAMQVSRTYHSFGKKSSNYFLIQLPSPWCCATIAIECVHVIRSLLLLSGDVETNPGPPGIEDVMSELGKLASGQSKLITEVLDLKSKLLTTDKTLSDLSKRMTDLERHYKAISTLRSDLDTIRIDATQMAGQIARLATQMDDNENRSRRNNLIFYNISDPNPKETFAESEKIVIRHCTEHLNFVIDPNQIDRAHRLGRHTEGRARPLIVKFNHFKTKESLLSNGPKFKGSNFSVGEDFPQPIRIARKNLIAFAKSQSTSYSLRFKTLHIGTKRYVFDHSTESVKEIS